MGSALVIEVWVLWCTYIDEESRCNAETAVDAVEHGPAEFAAVYAFLGSEAAGIEASTIVDAPDEDTEASQWAID